MASLKGTVVGAGYFSQFHFDAWNRIEGVQITGVCDQSAQAAENAAQQYNIAHQYSDFETMLDVEKPDFVDIVTRPDSHHALVQTAAARGVAVICQKALAPTFKEAKAIVDCAATADIRLMVHENFRFQPWWRHLHRMMNEGVIGDRLHSVSFRCRTGDGWQPNAYMDRQPYFRTMPRLLIFETGVHFIDTFRFLMGEIECVYSRLKQHNSEIAGEDAATVFFDFKNGATGLWDGNRYNEPLSQDARLTFGEAQIEGSQGTLRLYGDGRMTKQLLGQAEQAVDFQFERRGFAGDCVRTTQQHFIDRLQSGAPFETSGSEYLKTLQVVEGVYESAATNQPFCDFDRVSQ